MEKHKIKMALIGLGKMGSALAKRLLKANFDLVVYNRSLDKIKPITEAGATAAKSAREAVKNADIVLTILLDDKAVLEVVTGEQGFLNALKPGAIHLGISTILPSTSKKLTQLHAEHGSIYVASNVLGIPKVAEKGELKSFIAGPIDAVNSCIPIVEAYSQQIINVGTDAYQANVMKICANYLLAAAIECMGELYTYAEKSGLNTKFIEDFLYSVFASPVFNLYTKKIKERDFDEVNFDMQGGFKDLNLFQLAFTEAKVVPDIANIIKNKFIIALAQGMEKKDWSAIADVTRLQSGLN